MILTTQDLEKIRSYLVSSGIRDSQLKEVDEDSIPLDATAVVTINGKEYKTTAYNAGNNQTANSNAIVNITMDDKTPGMILMRTGNKTTTLDSGMDNEDITNIIY